FRRVAVPSDRMTARPVAGRHGANVERHADPVARVEPRTTDLGELPCGSKIARTHLGIGLKSSGCKDDAFRFDLDRAPLVLDAYTMNAVVIGDERQGARVVGDCNAVFPRDLGVRFDKTWAAAPGFHRQAAPEFEFSIDLVGLPSVDWNEADALLLHPAH